MEDHLQGAPVIRADGVSGRIVTVTTSAAGAAVVVIEFDDGARVAVSPQMLEAQADGGQRLLLAATSFAADRLTLEEDVVIPVLAEEIALSRQQVERGVVRVHKRVETHTATVDALLTTEEVTVERVPINALVEGAAPQMREEDGVTIIPVLEEVLVVEKRLLLREEVRLTRSATTANTPQTVALRRETVEIERAAFAAPEHAAMQPPSVVEPGYPEAEIKTEHGTEQKNV